MRNAWTNDCSALPVCCDVLHPWEPIIKIDSVQCWLVGDGIESVSGKRCAMISEVHVQLLLAELQEHVQALVGQQEAEQHPRHVLATE